MPSRGSRARRAVYRNSDAVLINRREVAGRRHFDLAHELFHVLTWDTMPPDHVEAAVETSRNRVEQLANKFASAVLMPAAVLARFSAWSGLSKADRGRRLEKQRDGGRFGGDRVRVGNGVLWTWIG